MRKRKISADRALYMAAGKGELQKVRKLLSAGANIHAWNDAALAKASWRGRLDVVKYLLEKDGEKADIHAGKDMAVREAAMKNRWDIVRYLAQKGADVSADGYLVWSRSVLHGDPETVRCLLENGANVHAKNDWAIAIAALNRRQEMVVVLAGWIFREEAWKGRLPLDAIREAERLSVILENSVSLDDCKGNAVVTGAMKGAAAGVALIMDYGAAAAKRLRGADK